MSKKNFSESVEVKTGADGEPIIAMSSSTAVRMDELAGLETPRLDQSILNLRRFLQDNAKKKMFEELRQDINASKQVVQEMIERIKNPPNMKERYISFDAMPTALQRVVRAYIAVSEANRELDEAIKALATEPRSSA